MRQYESRKESEALRKKSQAAVSTRAVMIQDLESVLRKRAREVEKTTVEIPEILEKKAKFGKKDTTLYNAYFENLNALYERLDDPTRKMNGNTEYFETIGVGRVPFGFQRTCDAVWELLSVPHRQEGRLVYEGLPDPENSLALQFCCPYQRENGEMLKLRTYQVARRYVETNRLVVVWRGLCEADSEFSGMNSDETGWCIDDKLDQFVELLVKTGAEDNREIELMMERLILDDALATDGLEIDDDGNLTSLEV
ncbi:uncharacterized protein PITG_09117 [Phytophthora infestans T30-4]|uniref:M96 mating-specific protein family n=1 Tax=Phytophthora infestans (strain T30-4) TaxID=403677 RepID=D0NBR1_PHYIT|nr:uncharacterized protein PITG_09117 [Phytophthora infestans T30-4]EEY55216.1 conserved hypothetical protein [Phytophthora infestans T30-4]|eukprot:XP_002903440.1 conserved hypothetical protein [Phytophthora infestans T30-4]